MDDSTPPRLTPFERRRLRGLTIAIDTHTIAVRALRSLQAEVTGLTLSAAQSDIDRASMSLALSAVWARRGSETWGREREVAIENALDYALDAIRHLGRASEKANAAQICDQAGIERPWAAERSKDGQQ